MNARFFASLIFFAYVVVFVSGCDHCECDKGGALSSCQLAPCTPHHDLLAEMTSCEDRGMKCCRMTCDGPGTMCLREKAPCPSGVTDLGPKACKQGYKCVKAPRRLRTKLQLS